LAAIDSFDHRGPLFKDYFNQPNRAEIGTMVAILEVGALISSLGVGRIGDIIGRRKTILYGSIVFFVGGALQTFALVHYRRSFPYTSQRYRLLIIAASLPA